jgi:pimeloyl-ACP methyl ester carboxylesterase
MSNRRTLVTVLKPVLRIVGILLFVYAIACAFIYFRQRSFLFFPTHLASSSQLTPWSDGQRTIGYCREVPHPATIWLMAHGNAGQAADRAYVVPCLSGEDSLYVLEYPGYGAREGTPTLESMNCAAAEAYRLLRSRYPMTPVCVLGESIGSGPACALAREKQPPDKIVLVVPFDRLANVACRHFPCFPVRYMLWDRWDNVESLRAYAGPLQIFAAEEDTIIPMQLARSLAGQVAKAQFTPIPGGHNDWPEASEVKIRR